MYSTIKHEFETRARECVCVFYMIYPSCYNAKCTSVIASVVMSVWTNGWLKINEQMLLCFSYSEVCRHIPVPSFLIQHTHCSYGILAAVLETKQSYSHILLILKLIQLLWLRGILNIGAYVAVVTEGCLYGSCDD